MKLKEPKNVNYAAQIVKIGKIVELDNCDNVVAGIFNATQVIVKKGTIEGTIGVYFPAETKISPLYLATNNLNTDASLNVDKDVKGYINKCRLKCLKFRGHKSEGMFMPLSSLSDFASEKEIATLKAGDCFDTLNGKILCEKYVIIDDKNNNGNKNIPKHKKGEKRFSRLIESQFRFHNDTANLKVNFHRINPEHFISVSRKYHGCSAIAGKLLTNVKPTLIDKVKQFFGVPKKQEYALVYSSRNIIKNKYVETNKHYIKAQKEEVNKDVWENTAKALEPLIPNGVTLYYEIVGNTPNGRCIQKKYHYGAEPLKCNIYVYRITSVNNVGQVIEYSFNQIKEFCNNNGISHVKEFYYGRAKDMFPEIIVDGNWHENVLNKMVAHAPFDMEIECSMNMGMPAEGCVVRIDSLYAFNAFKLKSYQFLLRESKQMDSGEVDIETEESVSNE